MDLNTISGCRHFLETQTPAAIAARLRVDQQICRDGCRGGLPSLLVHCLPPTSSPAADAVSSALCGDTPMPAALRRLRYTGISQGIKSHLADMSPDPPPLPAHLVPSDDDLTAALKVLQYLQLPPGDMTGDTPLTDVIACVQSQLSLGAAQRALKQATVTPPAPKAPNPNPNPSRRKQCYICHYRLTAPHALYPSLCNPCGAFNVSEASLSLPPTLDLSGKTALVTGGRTNLGFHTALRLLRCGAAAVIVSSRYPRDAAARYLRERDSARWRDRLGVVGADFRRVGDVFALVTAVRRRLRGRKLDVLVNNAAQTWTDSVGCEAACIAREEALAALAPVEAVVVVVEVGTGYVARVRGGGHRWGVLAAHDDDGGGSGSGSGSSSGSDNNSDNDNDSDTPSPDVPPKKSSWTQGLHDIPYEDVVTAYGVNAFAPLVLVRELLPLMRPVAPTAPGKPTGYIINVSAREGQPEDRPAHKRAGYHVHTNMAKAALNMLTETEAAVAWRRWKVAMNSVDPGYLSADEQWVKMWGWEGEECPIGWEDGAGRVLWPVARGEVEGVAVWGRFLKHFVSVRGTR